MRAIDELEKEWQTADDGFETGIDFKTWLANRLIFLNLTFILLEMKVLQALYDNEINKE